MHGGIEWLVDARGCVPARLRDRTAVLGVLDRIVAAMELHVVSTAVHAFPGEGGITALYLLAESHLTIHTFRRPAPRRSTRTAAGRGRRRRGPRSWASCSGRAR